MSYPEFIRGFPRAHHTYPGIDGFMVAGEKGLVVLWDFTEDTVVPPHAHCAQWGVVFTGSIDFTINGVRRTYGAGEQFFVPDGAIHSAFIPADSQIMDVFADRDRYAPTSV